MTIPEDHAIILNNSGPLRFVVAWSGPYRVAKLEYGPDLFSYINSRIAFPSHWLAMLKAVAANFT